MSNVRVALVLLVTVLAWELEGSPIPLPIKTPRIRGGDPVGPTDIPYAVGLMIQQTLANRWCGGALVSLNYVLTAASCFSEIGATTVLLGASDMTNVEDIIPATEVIPHPSYYPGQSFNDIALVRLLRPATLSESIRPARLPNRRQVDSQFTGQLATISGWGALSPNAPEILPMNHLYRITNSIIANTACNLRYLGAIVDTQVCASAANGSPCQGDQGGPLTVTDADGRSTVIGIYSYISALGCGSDWPPVYTRVASYLYWIEANSDVLILNDFEYGPFPTTVAVTTTIFPTSELTSPTTELTPPTTELTPPTTEQTTVNVTEDSTETGTVPSM